MENRSDYACAELIDMPTESDFDLKWPKKGDRLLQAKSDLRHNVKFEENESERHVQIWSGYIRAGHALVDECKLNSNHASRHELIYPALFCYRHGCELGMKWIIDRYGKYIGVTLADHLHHDLWKLWQPCREIILEASSGKEIELLDVVEQIIKNFHELDKSSFSFRYSQDRNGMAVQLPRIAFEIKNIKDVIEALDNLFTAADALLDAYSLGVES